MNASISNNSHKKITRARLACLCLPQEASLKRTNTATAVLRFRPHYGQQNEMWGPQESLIRSRWHTRDVRTTWLKRDRPRCNIQGHESRPLAFRTTCPYGHPLGSTDKSYITAEVTKKCMKATPSTMGRTPAITGLHADSSSDLKLTFLLFSSRYSRQLGVLKCLPVCTIFWPILPPTRLHLFYI